MVTLGGVHTTVKMAATATVTFTATLRNVKYCSHLSLVNKRKMATVDIVLLWITLFSRLQSCVTVGDRRIRRRRLSYDVLHQRCLPRSRGSLSRLLSWSSLLVLPPFQDTIRSLRAPRRFWAAPREQGFWET